MNVIRFLLVPLFVAGLFGCGGDGMYPVQGTVSWNGEPIAKGHITFHPTNPAQRPESSPIVDGKFAFRSLPGDKKVEIFADRPVGEPDPTMHLQRYEQYIPTRYNEQTELTVNVDPNQKNEFEFNLVEGTGDKKAGSGLSTGVSAR